MAIRQKEYCDICELEHGEESDKARIIKDPKCPAFPQLTWVYYKEGYQIMSQMGKPILHKGWLGQPNRLEFCAGHASEFNSLLKAFARKDTRLQKALDEISSEDCQAWDKKQKAKQREFAKMIKEESKDAKRD